MAPILSVQNLSVGYGKKQVIFEASLEVLPGEILLITGGNGSGKSTLLKTIFGLLRPWNAEAQIHFHPDPAGAVLSTRPASLNLTKGLAYLSQKNSVFDDLSVEDNLRLAGQLLQSRQEFAIRRAEVLAYLPSLVPLLHRKPERMSGGERQMVALGLLLLHRPKLLLLDEPAAGLSERLAVEILQLIGQLQRSLGFAAIIVEHRIQEASAIADRSMMMQLGHMQTTN